MENYSEVSKMQTEPTQTAPLDHEIEVKRTELAAQAKKFIQAYKRNDPWALTDSAQQIRRLSTKPKSDFMQFLIDSGSVYYMMKVFDQKFYQRTRLLMECSWIMINISADKTQCVEYIMKLGIIPKAMPFLKYPDMEIRRNILWIFRNLIIESIQYRDLMIKEGILKHIEYMLNSFAPRKVVIRAITALICHLAKLRFDIVRPLLRYLTILLNKFNDKEIVRNIVKAIAFMSDGCSNQIQEILNLQIGPKLIKLTKADDEETRLYALRTIGNLLTGRDDQVAAVLTYGGIEILGDLLDDNNQIIQREAGWALSNIMAGTPEQIQQVFQHKNGEIINKLLRIIQTSKKEVAKECMYCIGYVCQLGTVQQITQLISQDVIRVILDALKPESENSSYLTFCLESIKGILDLCHSNRFMSIVGTNLEYAIEKIEECDGIQTIEKFQNHINHNVYMMAQRIVENYFKLDDVVE